MTCKTSRSLHQLARILNVYIKAISEFSHVYSTDGFNNTLLSQGCILENGSPVWKVDECTFQGRGEVSGLWSPEFSSRVSPAVLSSWLPPPTTFINNLVNIQQLTHAELSPLYTSSNLFLKEILWDLFLFPCHRWETWGQRALAAGQDHRVMSCGLDPDIPDHKNWYVNQFTTSPWHIMHSQATY